MSPKAFDDHPNHPHQHHQHPMAMEQDNESDPDDEETSLDTETETEPLIGEHCRLDDECIDNNIDIENCDENAMRLIQTNANDVFSDQDEEQGQPPRHPIKPLPLTANKIHGPVKPYHHSYCCQYFSLDALTAFCTQHLFPQCNPTFVEKAIKLSFCVIGLQATYLTWGYLQELIMTTPFQPTTQAPNGFMPSATFCVLCNRIVALMVAIIAVKIKHGVLFHNNMPPLTAFAPCAISNTLSSYSQYASLKYVSFPVQTIFKSSKIIPVMMMGKIIKGTVYPCSQYVEAFLITVGVAIFSLFIQSTHHSQHSDHNDPFGFMLLILYITSDSFTAQWQSKIYQQYGNKNVDSYQMMLGVNIFAITTVAASLAISGDVPIVWEFIRHNPQVLRYNAIAALSSASGQLCLFYTIQEFGPMIFTIIMTVRQLISIVLSSLIFGHVIAPPAMFGAAIVFGVIAHQIHNKYQQHNSNSTTNNNKSEGESRCHQQPVTTAATTAAASTDANGSLSNHAPTAATKATGQ